MSSTVQKLKMLGGMLNGQKAIAGPAYVVLDLTRRCNTVCVGCYFHCVQEREPTPGDHSVQDLPVELLSRLATELAGVGTSEIMLLGEGEPLLHPSFFEIVSAFKQCGMTVRTFTNGTLLNEETCNKLVASGLDTLLVSVWGVTREEHLQNHPGITLSHLDKRRNGVRMLTEAKQGAGSLKPELRIQFILNRNNYSNIDGRIEFALASGCEEVGFGIFRDYGGMFEGLALGEDELSILEPALNRARDAFAEHGIRHDIPQYLERIQMGPERWTKLPCYAGWYSAEIKVDGTVLPCAHCATVVGNLHQNTFSEIWNGPAYRSFRRAGMLNPEVKLLHGCDCSNCCQVTDNMRVGRVFDHIRPFVARRLRSTSDHSVFGDTKPQLATPPSQRVCGK